MSESRLAVLNWGGGGRYEKGLLGVRTYLPDCSLIYVTADHNTADVTNLEVFVSFMLYERLTVM